MQIIAPLLDNTLTIIRQWGFFKELRAVTSTGDVHILANNGATEEQRKKFSAAYQQRRMKAANAADSKIRKGERINKDEYVKSRLEAFMSEHAEDYNLTYSKAKIKPRSLEKSGESGIIKTNKPLKINIQLFAEKDLSKQSTKAIQKGIKSLEERVLLHNDKISNPSKYIPNYDSLDERYKSGIIRHWKKEVEDFTESINNRIEELKKRGDI